MNIFVIDDSDVARKMLIRIISEDEDVRVVGEAGSGVGAIMALRETQPDVVMLEADISGTMGAEEIIREIGEINPTISIILCTDDSSNHMVIPLYELGIEQFISKPYSKHKILPVIGKVKQQAV